jgi:putative transcriptional regulator
MSILKEAIWDEPGIPARSSQPPSIWFRRLTFGRLHMHISLAAAEIQDGMSKITVYNRLSALRAERGMSRQDLARALDIGYQTVVVLERGEYNPSLELALHISQLFALPVEVIFSSIPVGSFDTEAYPCS